MKSKQVEAIDSIQGRVIETDYANPVGVAREIASSLPVESDGTESAIEVGFQGLAATPFGKWVNFPTPATYLGAGADGYAELVADMRRVTPESVADRYGEDLVEYARMCTDVPAAPRATLAAVVSVVARGFHGHIVQDAIIDDIDNMTRANVCEESKGIDARYHGLTVDVKKNDRGRNRTDSMPGFKSDNVDLMVSFADPDATENLAENEVRIGVEPSNTDNSETPSHSIARATRGGRNPDSAATWD